MYLTKGSTVGIIAPANFILEEGLLAAKSEIESWGLNVVLGQHIFSRDKQFGGTDDERAEDLQYMLDSPHIDAFFAANGGYGTIRIIDKVDFSFFIKRPKLVVGYSDFTVLLNHVLRNFNIPCIHGSMPLKFSESSSETLHTLKAALFGEKLKYTWPSNELNIEGESKATLIGGNLTTIISILGSASEVATEGRILFIEDRGEMLYHLDRMMMCLKRNGKLAGLKGLLVGSFSEMRDNKVPFGKSAEEIIYEHVKEYGYPVCFNFPAGHMSDNRALILGTEVIISCNAVSTTLRFT